MTAGNYTIVCEQGATLVRVFTWQNPDSSAINLTGFSARMQVRETYEAALPLLDLASTGPSPAIVLGGPAGTITLTVSATTTSALDPGTFPYDLELESSTGVVTRLLEGAFTVIQGVTH